MGLVDIKQIEDLKNNKMDSLQNYLVAKMSELVEYKISTYVEKELPHLIDEALDRQRKTVADELVRILLAKQLS